MHNLRNCFLFFRQSEVSRVVLFWRTDAADLSYVLLDAAGGPASVRLDGRMRWRVPANNSSAFQRLSRLLPPRWYARNASCQQMLLTHDDALGIRMDATSIFNLGTKRHYSRVNPVSLVRNSFVYRNHAEILSSSTSAQYSPGLPHCQLVLGL